MLQPCEYWLELLKERQNMNQLFFSPQQTQNRAAYYPTSQITQLRPSPRWTAQGARPHRK